MNPPYFPIVFAWVRNLRAHKYIAIASALILTGCAGLLIDPYGHVAKDAENVEVNGGQITMTNNIPSIAQGFDPYPEGDDPNNPLKQYEIPTSGHEAIDIVGKRGTPVLAAASGTVRASYFEPFYGNRIVIDNGRRENGLFIRTRYFHLTKRWVEKGQSVHRGQQIGTLGSTGLLASYPHLHFEVRTGYLESAPLFDPVNPHLYWARGVGRPTCFRKHQAQHDMLFKITYPVPCRNFQWK